MKRWWWAAFFFLLFLGYEYLRPELFQGLDAALAHSSLPPFLARKHHLMAQGLLFAFSAAYLVAVVAFVRQGKAWQYLAGLYLLLFVVFVPLNAGLLLGPGQPAFALFDALQSFLRGPLFLAGLLAIFWFAELYDLF